MTTHTLLTDDRYRHPVMITEAPPGIPATVLGTFTATDLSVVAYAPRPGRDHKVGMAADILDALGKDDDLTGKSRHSSNESELVSLWLTAHRTQIVIATACQRTAPETLIELVNAALLSPARLILATDNGFTTTLAQSLRSITPARVPWPQPPTATATEDGIDGNANAHRDDRIVFPDVEYWAFYATAQRQLTADDFRPVHDLYCETQHRVTTWLQDLDNHSTAMTVHLAHDCLKTLVEEQLSFDHITVVLRATQATFHNHGWYLDIDERELRNGLVRFTATANTLMPYRRLRGYREPTRAATVALYLAGATPAAIKSLTVDDLAQWHQHPTQPLANTTVPDEAHPYIRAVLLARANDGHHHTDPAFPGDERRVRLDIRQAARDLDLNIGDANLNETSTRNSRRIPETIVKLERIA